MLENIVIGIVSGVVASIAASAIFLYATRRKVSDIKLSDDIILNKDGVILVKFVNKTSNPIAGVKVLMYGAKYNNAAKSSVVFSLISEKAIPFVHGFSKHDKQLKYAIVASLPLNDGATYDDILAEYHDVHIWIIGADTYYGNHIATNKTYDLATIKKDSIFELGENTGTRLLS
jgi:hypothetical protein